jgi:hypothetical protein
VDSRQVKFIEAVKLLDSESGLAFKEKDTTEYLRIKAQIMRDMAAGATNDTDRVRVLAASQCVYAELVALNDDDWFFLTQYIDGEFEIAERQDALSAADSATTTATAVASAESPAAAGETLPKNIVGAGSKKQAGQALKRGPFLAEVEFEFRLWQRTTPAWQAQGAASPAPATAALPTGDSAALEKAIVAYFRQFGSKSCFFYDILKYLDELPHVSRVRLTNVCMGMVSSVADNTMSVLSEGVKNIALQEKASEDGKEATSKESTTHAAEAAQVKRYQLSLSIQQLMRYNYSATPDVLATTASSSSSSASAAAHSTLTEKDLESSGKSMFDQFLATTKLPSSILRIQSERGVGDHYLTLFAHHYFSFYLLTKNKKYLLDIIMALELGLTKYSQFNYQFKLWLIRLYVHPEIAAFHRAQQLYKSLDIKQIQHDITSHLLMEDAIRYGHLVSDALTTCNKLIQWHSTADREDVQTTQFGYERSNYTKIIEFVDFRERRQASMALYQARVMKAYGGILALGISGATVGGTAAVVPTATSSSDSGKIEKDLTSVHAFLAKSGIIKRIHVTRQLFTVADDFLHLCALFVSAGLVKSCSRSIPTSPITRRTIPCRSWYRIMISPSSPYGMQRTRHSTHCSIDRHRPSYRHHSLCRVTNSCE